MTVEEFLGKDLLNELREFLNQVEQMDNQKRAEIANFFQLGAQEQQKEKVKLVLKGISNHIQEREH